MHRFFLIRHGESQSNAGLATTNPKHVELTARGNEQAEQVAAYLKKYASLHLIVTSAYLRTKQTAAPTMKEFHVESEEWDVQEFTYLSPAYLGYSTAIERRPLVDAFWEQCNPFYQDSRGSESFSAFIRRVRHFIRQLSERYENIAVFSHEQFITAVLWYLKNWPEEITSDTMSNFKHFFDHNRIPNGGILEILVNRSRDSIDAWNTNMITDHLKGSVQRSDSLLKQISDKLAVLIL